jgi:redox-sensitive bicupin YhaK (pirin superfamily)
MSPGDLGRVLKPFVFLDRFEVSLHGRGGDRMPLHPHSGIATITVFTDGDVTFDDPTAGRGTLGYGGVEWARAARGIWHGRELSGGSSPRTQGFQLWIALPRDLELGESESQYVEAGHIPSVGPARVVVGEHAGERSPVRAPPGLTYLLVTLTPGERFTYEPPTGHAVLWIAIAKGGLAGADRLSHGELVAFDASEEPVTFEGGERGATFVLGSAVPHPHALHLGSYSVHTSAEALAAGERHIVELKRRIDAAGGLVEAKDGSTPVYRG